MPNDRTDHHELAGSERTTMALEPWLVEAALAPPRSEAQSRRSEDHREALAHLRRSGGLSGGANTREPRPEAHQPRVWDRWSQGEMVIEPACNVNGRVAPKAAVRK